MAYSRSYVSALPKITNCGTQNIKWLIYFVLQSSEKSKDWKCSACDFAS